MDADDRILVFVPYLDEGKKLAKALGCHFYSGDNGTSDDNRKMMHQAWIDGDDTVMMCMSAFGAGNDYPHVRVVAHAGSPMELIGYRYLNCLHVLLL
jgi:superfamily II DNA helicase RecQ